MHDNFRKLSIIRNLIIFTIIMEENFKDEPPAVVERAVSDYENEQAKINSEKMASNDQGI